MRGLGARSWCEVLVRGLGARFWCEVLVRSPLRSKVRGLGEKSVEKFG